MATKKRSPAVKKKSPARKSAQPSAAPSLATRVRELGVLRIALFCFTVFFIVVKPAPGSPAIAEGWDLLSTMIAPVFAPLLMMLLLLDALMARVFMAEKEGEPRLRFRRIVRTDLSFALLLLLFWLPYFMALGQRVS